MTTAGSVQWEASIHWDEDPKKHEYVRQVWLRAGTRQRPVKQPSGRRVGYAILRPDAPSDSPRSFYRRCFYVMGHDRSLDPEGAYTLSCPVEAVDPLTVRPGVAGIQNARAWGGPLPQTDKQGGRT